MKGFLITLDGFSHQETTSIRRIRSLYHGEEKEFLIKCFEVETGKKFPPNEPVEPKIKLSNSKIRIGCKECQQGCQHSKNQTAL